MAKGGKKGGKKKGKNSASKDSATKEANENSKSYFLNLLENLDEKLKTTKENCEILTAQNKEISINSSQKTKDKNDMLEYYNRMRHLNDLKIRDLKEELSNAERHFEARSNENSKKFDLLNETMDNKIEGVKDKNLLISSQVAGMHDFQTKRDELMKKFEDLEETLVKVRKNQSAELYILEKEQVQEKDKLKKEMQRKVEDVAAEFRKVSNRQMLESTKKTISVNITVNNRLVKLNYVVKMLMEENDLLSGKLQEQTRRLEILRKNELSLNKKNKCSAKLISMLVEKANEVETDLCVTEEVLLETEEKLEEYEAEKESRNHKKLDFERQQSLHLHLNEVNFQMKKEVENRFKKLTKMRNLVDRCCNDLGYFKFGLSDNILPNLLSVLVGNSSSEVKREVERKIMSEGSGSKEYKKCSVGIVPSC